MPEKSIKLDITIQWESPVNLHGILYCKLRSQKPELTYPSISVEELLMAVGSYSFDAHGIKYNHVCGKITAYQHKRPDAFGGQQLTIDQTCG